MLDFLSHLYSSGLSYSSINVARAALSTCIFIDGSPVGQHYLVVRLLKGIFQERPKLPKNIVTWDPNIVLLYIKSLGPSTGMTLMLLAAKVATLIWLLGAQRGQSLHLIDIRNLRMTKFSVKITFGDILKTTRAGFQQKKLK